MKSARLLPVLLATAFLAGCGSGPPSTESVVRAWSQALNQDDNDTAANLFAPNARVVQGNTVLRLKTHEDAVAWNSALPCSGLITSIHSRGAIVTATFRLGDRAKSHATGRDSASPRSSRSSTGRSCSGTRPHARDPAGPSV